MASIDEVMVADERDERSNGMQLARKLGVERAPFFVVEDAGSTQVYTVYFKFVKQVLGATTTNKAENQEILRDNPQLDFI